VEVEVVAVEVFRLPLRRRGERATSTSTPPESSSTFPKATRWRTLASLGLFGSSPSHGEAVLMWRKHRSKIGICRRPQRALGAPMFLEGGRGPLLFFVLFCFMVEREQKEKRKKPENADDSEFTHFFFSSSFAPALSPVRIKQIKLPTPTEPSSRAVTFKTKSSCCSAPPPPRAGAHLC
jgi:hypothetical protein